ncbi:MAG: NCS2 family permease [Mycoplasmatales bacterium]
MNSFLTKLDNYFGVYEQNSNFKTEILAGITTFLSMSYVLFVIPATLSETGMDLNAVFVATALSSVISTLIMGLYAKYPIGLAPGMGMQAFFTYTVVLTMGYSWEQALFGIFCSGILFIILSISGIRKAIINIIPNGLKHSVTIGIGLFIAFIGMQNVGIIVGNESTLVQLGNLASPVALTAIIGTVITFILIMKNKSSAIFLGMLITIGICIVFQLAGADVGMTMPTGIISAPPSIEPVAGKLFMGGDFSQIMVLLTDFKFWIVVLSILFVDFFDTTGTIIAVGGEAGIVTAEGEIKNSEKILLADSLATTVGSILGVSSVTSYVESMTGIKIGGRTGLTAIVIALCFLLAIFFSPILSIVTASVTAPALISVGALMAMNHQKIDYSDFTEAATSFMTIIFMVLTYSISSGLAIGFVTYTILKLGAGKAKEIHPLIYGLTVIFLIYLFL